MNDTEYIQAKFLDWLVSLLNGFKVIPNLDEILHIGSNINFITIRNVIKGEKPPTIIFQAKLYSHGLMGVCGSVAELCNNEANISLA